MSNLSQYGNTSAASIPLALDEAVRRGDIKPGEVRSLSRCCGSRCAQFDMSTGRGETMRRHKPGETRASECQMSSLLLRRALNCGLTICSLNACTAKHGPAAAGD